MFPHGAVEISDTKNENYFKINSQRLNPFLESVPVNETAIGRFDSVFRQLYLFYISFHASIHLFHTLGSMHEIGVGEGSNMTNITKKEKKKGKKEIFFEKRTIF